MRIPHFSAPAYPVRRRLAQGYSKFRSCGNVGETPDWALAGVARTSDLTRMLAEMGMQ